MEKTRILVWDLPVRLFHWLLAATFAGAYVTAEAKGWRGVHLALGYAFVGLIAFRLLWGVIGSRHARFRSFAYGPRAVVGYLRSLLGGRPEHYVGHNPAGSWAIFALLALGLAVGATGWGFAAGAGKWMKEVHEGLASAMLALVALHVAGVVVGSLAHRENLVRAMVTGYKGGPAAEAIRGSGWHWAGAATLVALVAGIFGMAPTLPGANTAAAADARAATGGRDGKHGRHERDRHSQRHAEANGRDG